ncbi:MAG: hypothetical protein JW762_17300 [Dehalococcoidales bacterium]|nr:hypothetical protein [Dehalococcoidales bacterium]
MLLSFRRSLNVPVERITGVSTEKPGWQWGARAPGIHIPFLVKMGTYLVSDGREFWATTIGRPYLVIEMEGWNYTMIVLTMGENKLWAERIRQEIQAV